MAVVRLNFLSKMLGMHTNVTILLPSFDQGADLGRPLEEVYTKDAKYKVIWMLHGGSDDEAVYLHWTNIARYAAAYNCAVVLPNTYNSGYSNWPRGAQYYTFFVDELRQFLYSNFPLSDKREDNFIGGISMGSGGAMRVVMDRFDEFAAALILSGGFPAKPASGAGGSPRTTGHSVFRQRIMATGWPMPKSPKDVVREDVYTLAKRNAETGRPLPKMILCSGEDDIIAYEGTKTGIAALTELGYDVTGFILPGYKHEWDFWEICLRKAFSEWLGLERRTVTELSAGTQAKVEEKDLKKA